MDEQRNDRGSPGNNDRSGGRGDNRGGDRGQNRNDGRGRGRPDNRGEWRNGGRNQGRPDNRGDARNDGRQENRGDGRNDGRNQSRPDDRGDGRPNDRNFDNRGRDDGRGGRRRRRHRDRRGGRRRERSLDDLEREYVSRLRNDGVEKPVCALCDKPIIVINQAIKHKESGKPAHFDCIVRMLRETMRPGPNEKIAYLGGGSFGVIEERNQHGRIRFTIRERLQYEERKRRLDRDTPETPEPPAASEAAEPPAPQTGDPV